MVRNLKTLFRKWIKSQQTKHKIIKLAQGDSNLIAELAKVRTVFKKTYGVFAYKHIGNGKFKQYDDWSLFTRAEAEKHFKKIQEEF